MESALVWGPEGRICQPLCEPGFTEGDRGGTGLEVSGGIYRGLPSRPLASSSGWEVVVIVHLLGLHAPFTVFLQCDLGQVT